MQPRKRGPLPVFIAIGLILLAIGLGRSIVDLRARKGILTTRKEELARLEKERTSLKQRLSEASTPEFVEREARERLGFVKEGETVILMEAGTSKNGRQTPVDASGQPAWKRWWDVFF